MSTNIDRLVQNGNAIIESLVEFTSNDAKDVTLNYVKDDGSIEPRIFANIKKFQDGSSDVFVKKDYKKPVIQKVIGAGLVTHIKVLAGFRVKVGNTIITLTTDVQINLPDVVTINGVLSINSHKAGMDYVVVVKTDGTFYIAPHTDTEVTTITNQGDRRIIGGFHYGLTPHTEAKTGNKTDEDMLYLRGINGYSFWDLKKRPSADPRGKFFAFNKWHDIYPMDSEYSIRKFSSPFSSVGISNGTWAKSKIGAGATTYGRVLPLIPLREGGDGSVAYTKFDWFKAALIGKVAGCEMYDYELFPSIAYGVVENQSCDAAPNAYGDTGEINHFDKFTSKFGAEMITGVEWFWGANVGGNYGTTDWAWKSPETGSSVNDANGLLNPLNRGQIYSTSNNPTAVLLGGYRGDGAAAGSRASYWSYCVWNSYWYIGCRFACDDLELV